MHIPMKKSHSIAMFMRHLNYNQVLNISLSLVLNFIFNIVSIPLQRLWVLTEGEG